MVAEIARGHHTVPRFYLNGFADEDHRIGVVRLPGDTRYQQSSTKVSVVNDFYNVNAAVEQDVIEQFIADEIEAPAAAVFRKVLADQVWPLDTNDRTILSTFFGLQHRRGPNQRRMLNEIANAVAREGSLDTQNTAKPDESELFKLAHIRSMLDIEKYGGYYFGRSWMLVRFNRKRLLTCDTPVILLPHPDAPADATVGIGTAWAILFPLSRITGLMMFQHLTGEPHDVVSGHFDTIAEGSTYLAEQFNAATIRNARECIFHHPDDASLVPAELPEQRYDELSTSDPPREPVQTEQG